MILLLFALACLLFLWRQERRSLARWERVAKALSAVPTYEELRRIVDETRTRR